MKSITKFAGLLILFLALGIVACKKDKDETPDPKPKEPVISPYFIFAKIGNESHFETTVNVLVQTFKGTMVQKVISKTGDIYGVEIIIDLKIPSLPPTTDTSYWLVSPTQFANVDDELGSNPFPYFENGDTLNMTYTHTVADTTYTRTVKALAENVTVAPGIYSCIKVFENNDKTPAEQTYWVSKDAGLIKSTIKVVPQAGVTLIVDAKLTAKNF